jgi:hypothetical protein
MRASLRLAVLTAASAAALATTTSGASAAPNLVTYTNLHLAQNLALRAGDTAVTMPPQAGSAVQVWDMVYITNVPTVPDHSSPYLLRNQETGTCLQDMGEGRPATAVPCRPDPDAGSPQLWHHHREPDRIVDGSKYYYRISRSSGRVLTARPAPGAGTPIVVCAPAEPIGRAGAADPQLWRMQPA